MLNHPTAPYPDGDRSIIACPNCGSGEYLHNEDGNRNAFCGQCGQAIDWDDGTQEHPEPRAAARITDVCTGLPVVNAFVLQPDIDPAAVHALRAYAMRTEDAELSMALLDRIAPLERQEENPFEKSARALQTLFDKAWSLNCSSETRTEFTQFMTQQLSVVMQDFDYLVQNWLLYSGSCPVQKPPVQQPGRDNRAPNSIEKR